MLVGNHYEVCYRIMGGWGIAFGWGDEYDSAWPEWIQSWNIKEMAAFVKQAKLNAQVSAGRKHPHFRR